MQHISVMIIMQFLTGVTTASLFAVSCELIELDTMASPGE